MRSPRSAPAAARDPHEYVVISAEADYDLRRKILKQLVERWIRRRQTVAASSTTRATTHG
ncbi:MAG TPA: hypothetical protein PKJ98_14035 [Verrucomicrobiota bacterium]|nr:hypothetical protein [Verrucomicrobiota bacterium]